MNKIKEYLIVLICLVFILYGMQGQSSSIDSLQNVLKQTSVSDTIKADILYELCLKYQEDKTDSAIYFANRSLDYAINSNNILRKGKAIHQKGVCYDYKNNLDSCLLYLKEAENIYTSLGLKDKQSNAISDYGMAYYYRGNYEMALRNYLKALALRQEVGDKKNIAKSLNNIGLVYRSRKDYANALKYYRASLILKKEIGDELGIMNTMINMGSAFQRSEMYDSALYFANKAKDIAVKLDAKKDIINCKGNIGGALASLKKFAKAKTILLEAEQEAMVINFKSSLPTIYESLGSISKSNGDIDEAIHYYNKGLGLLLQGGSKESMAIYFKALSKIYMEKGDYKTAYTYLESSKNIYDTLMNIENSRQINEMSAVYESAEKEKEIQQLQTNDLIKTSELSARKKERNYFILSTLLFIALAGIAYKALTSNKKKKNQLNIQNELIEKSLKEKEVLLKEIHHRVKNNLQIVSSLLSLQSNYINDEKALDAIRESKNRVQSMAIIHQHLYQDESLVNINVKEYIEKLTEYIQHSYQLDSERIQLVTDIEPIQLDVDTMIPIGLVVNELISNCLKYAFPNNRKGTIHVMIKQSDVLKIEVYDDGIGMSNQDSHFNQNSFGHKMIHAFVKKLKGKIFIQIDNGTKVDIEIKKNNPTII